MYIITGGGTGIGRAIAHALANQGDQIVIIGRREENLKETASFSTDIRCLRADIMDPSDINRIMDYCASTPVKALVHNAGIIEPIAPLQSVSITAWEQVLHTNVLAPLQLTQALLPNLKGGRILHMGSGAAYMPIGGWSAYCVSKAALSMLTRCFQQEFSDPVVASVMPGITETDMTAIIRESTYTSAENLAFHRQLFEQGRLVKPDTVASFVSWLLKQLSQQAFMSQEWDIYDQSHHRHWLVPPAQVPTLTNVESSTE